MQGVYAITCTATGEQYVGKALHIYHRWAQHTQLLTQGRHPSPRLAKAWAEHGPICFTWQILQVVEDARDLRRLEQEHIARLQPVYNQRSAYIERRAQVPRRSSSDYLSVWEVAERLGKPEETVRRWLRSGELRGIRLARKAGWRVRQGDLRAFLDQRTPGGDKQ
jgi:excisionase family DNA binding protein